MTNLPLHPALVHLPLALAVLVPLVALFVWLGQKSGKLSPQTWMLVIGLQLLLVGSGYLSMQLGENDEETVEHFVKNEAAIETHEEAAELFVFSEAALLVLIIAAGFLGKIPYLKPFSVLTSVVLMITALNAGHTGGKLIYEEGAAQAYSSTNLNTHTLTSPESGEGSGDSKSKD